jgi:hypothetical protein
VTFIISADDPRTIRALEIAAAADQWLNFGSRDGQPAYGVPSQSAPGRYYLVTSSSCDCPDFRGNLDVSAPTAPAQPDEPRACKHMLAVRLYRELVRAQQPQSRARQPTPRPRGHLTVVR